MSINLLTFIFFIFLIKTLSAGVLPDNAFTEDARGSSVFNVLKSPVSPRFFSLGGAGINEYGIDSVFYNPSGAIENNLHSFYLDFQSEVSSSKRSDIAYLKRDEYKSYGLYISYMDYGDFIKIDNNGVTGGYFTPYDIILSGVYSGGKEDRFGLSLKYIHSDMVYYSLNSIAFDLGFILKGSKTYYSFLVRNLGFGVRYNDKTYPLPLELACGIKYQYSKELSGVFESIMPSYDSMYFMGGFEYLKKFSDLDFYIRGGVNLKNKDSLGWGGVFSGGIGIYFDNFGFDYAFIPYSNLDMTHKFSLRFRYGDVSFVKSEKKNFESFVKKQIALKKKIVVVDFKFDNDPDYAGVVSNSIEERLVEKGYAVITKLDPTYISTINGPVKNIEDVIKKAKKMNSDFAVWAEIKQIDEEKVEVKAFLIDLSKGYVNEFDMASNKYDIKNISLKISQEVMKRI